MNIKDNQAFLQLDKRIPKAAIESCHTIISRLLTNQMDSISKISAPVYDHSKLPKALMLIPDAGSSFIDPSRLASYFGYSVLLGLDRSRNLGKPYKERKQ